MNRILHVYQKIREWARDYEPAVAATLAAALFQMLVGVGIAVGDWPGKVDAVLAFVAVLATVLAGRKIRARVYSAHTHDRTVTASYVRGLRHGRL